MGVLINGNGYGFSIFTITGVFYSLEGLLFNAVQ